MHETVAVVPATVTVGAEHDVAAPAGDDEEAMTASPVPTRHAATRPFPSLRALLVQGALMALAFPSVSSVIAYGTDLFMGWSWHEPGSEVAPERRAPTIRQGRPAVAHPPLLGVPGTMADAVRIGGSAGTTGVVRFRAP